MAEIKIRQQLCPSGKYSIKCPYSMKPTRIVVHNTGNDAPAANEVSYMTSNNSEVSFHIAVDDKEAVQGLPLDRNAWACGDDNGAGNRQGINIEICYSKSGGARFDAAEKNAAKLIAQLLKKYGWGIDKVTKHQDYNGKYCPHRTLDRGWSRFLDMVKAEMNMEDDMTKAEVLQIINEYMADLAKKQASGWAEKAIADCKAKGIMVGDADGNFRPQSLVTRQELAQVASNMTKR